MDKRIETKPKSVLVLKRNDEELQMSVQGEDRYSKYIGILSELIYALHQKPILGEEKWLESFHSRIKLKAL